VILVVEQILHIRFSFETENPFRKNNGGNPTCLQSRAVRGKIDAVRISTHYVYAPSCKCAGTLRCDGQSLLGSLAGTTESYAWLLQDTEVTHGKQHGRCIIAQCVQEVRWVIRGSLE